MAGHARRSLRLVKPEELDNVFSFLDANLKTIADCRCLDSGWMDV
jgi:hypothetical protein